MSESNTTPLMSPRLLGQNRPIMTSSVAPILRKGFRIFFLGAGSFAVLALPMWLLSLYGALPAHRWDPLAWHRHEMVFGYTAAVISGFLLTAVSNWTSRETLTGPPLLALFALWTAGRLAMCLSGFVAPAVVAVVDASFLPALALVIARPIAATRNRRNYGIVLILLALTAANVATHLEAAGVAPGLGRAGAVTGVNIVTILMLLISGRIVPAFTRNATGLSSIRSIPALDRAAVGGMVLFTIAGLVAPDGPATSALALVLAAMAAARTMHWGFRAALRDPMLWILHLGHGCVAIGLFLRGLTAFVPTIPPSLGIHAVTVGGIGLLTLGMMTRVALGHTGRPIRASRSMEWAFVMMTLAVPLRAIMPGLLPTAALWFWTAAGVLWTAAFTIYLVNIAPVLVRARADGRPG